MKTIVENKIKEVLNAKLRKIENDMTEHGHVLVEKNLFWSAQAKATRIQSLLNSNDYYKMNKIANVVLIPNYN